MTSEITELPIQTLLDPATRYRIPTYQRNYAWGEAEITQLIQDIIDFKNNSVAKSYYLGTLVVYKRIEKNEVIYETIDGQQRLTTLSLLCFVLKQENSSAYFTNVTQPNLDFESRSNSTEAINWAFKGDFSSNKDFNEDIVQGYYTVKRILRVKLEEHSQSYQDFYETLAKEVKILRVPVPEDTDLNHYFEVMNNRGEQLEKHEVLKAELIEVFEGLPEQDKQTGKECFNLIWEACSNMEKYVQYGFTTTQRNLLFGSTSWDELKVNSFDDICSLLETELKKDISEKALTLSELITIQNSPDIPSAEDEQGSDRFNTVINFQNFLIHVLKIQTQNKDISLDDKKLIPFFKAEQKSASSRLEFVKDFAFALLKSKFLFDKYIIKREFLNSKDNWSLKRLKWYGDNPAGYVNTFGAEEGESINNRRILMLLSMFHVSAPTMVYKYWLNAAMHFLFYQEEITSEKYEDYLFELSKAIVFDRFLSKNSKEYDDIIFNDDGKCKATKEDLDFQNLTFGNIKNNLVFNFLDYVLWLEFKDPTSHPEWKGKIDVEKLRKFEFTFRSSVEHYYPQKPMDGHPEIDQKQLHSFGNLCLISHSKNSRLSNLPPAAKESHYSKGNMDSIKQHLMMTTYGEPRDWNEQKIAKHDLEMKTIFLKQL